MAFAPTDWGDFEPEEYEVGAPATSLHFERWFRNVVAAAQGAVGAPRVQFGVGAGNDVRGLLGSASAVYVPGGVEFGTFLSFGTLNTGVLRLTLEVKSTEANQGAFFVRLLRTDGTIDVATLDSLTTSFVERTVDVPVVTGDKISIEWEYSGVNGKTFSIQDLTIKTDGRAFLPHSFPGLCGN